MRKPCCEKSATNKGAWSRQEDQKLIDYIQKHGEGCWHALPEAAGLQRCGKSCRLRWVNYLKPDLKRGNFEEDEIDLIIKLHALLGNRWSLIAGRLPGRTDNEVKNYWNTHLKKKLIQMGVDPKTHRPKTVRSGAAVAATGCVNVEQIDNTDDDGHSQRQFQPHSQPFSTEPKLENTDTSREKDSDATSSSLCLLPDLNLDLSLIAPRAVQGRPQLFAAANASAIGPPTPLLLFR